MDMAMLTASMQSMAMTLQQLLAENQRLAEELKSIKTERAAPPEKPEESSPKHAFGGTAGVKRPLIGSFDREAARQHDVPKVPYCDDQLDLKDIDKKDVVLPTKLKGDVTQLRHWHMKFLSFLNRRGARWPKLLEEVRGHRKTS